MRKIRIALALVAGVGLAYGAGVAGRWYVARGLATEWEKRGTNVALLRELAKRPDHGLRALVQVAASPDRSLADPARLEIDRLSGLWRRQSEQEEAGRSVVWLSTLARELERIAKRLSPSGQRWAARTVEQILLTCPAKPESVEWVDCVIRCDDVLRATQRRSLIPDRVIAAQPSGSTDPKEALHETAESMMPNSPPERPSSAPSRENPPLAQEAREEKKTVTHSPAAQSPAPATVKIPKPDEWRPEWLSPPPELTPEGVKEPQAAPISQGTPIDGLAGRSDRELLGDWFKLAPPETPTKESEPEVVALRQEIVRRGYEEVAPSHVARLLSEDSTTRLALVEELLKARSGDAPRLLLLLAKDEEPRVRVAALSALGSSGDERLTTAAWRLAIRDSDPRVARLAGELKKSKRR